MGGVRCIDENKAKMAALSSSLRTDELSKLEAEGGMSFEEAVRDLATKAGRRVINILATGKLAAGKSALINGLIGEDVAPESDSLDQETKEVVKYFRNIDGILFNVWDSPGIEANTEDETANMQIIENKVHEADLLLFCIRMDESRLRKQDLNTIVHFTKAFGVDVWQHTVFALTFANMVVPVRSKNDPVACKSFFTSRLELWRRELRDALRSAGVNSEVIEKVPIMPIGYHKEPSLPDGQENWLTAFWSVCLQTMKERVQPALLKVNLSRLKSAQEVPIKHYSLPFYRQPIIVETLRKTILPGAAGVVGGIIGLLTSGPFGMAVGSALGAVAGYVAQGVARSMAA